MIRLLLCFLISGSVAFAQVDEAAEPLPIDSLWKSESFRKAVTGSYGIDSRIEPLITVDEEFYLNEAAESLAEGNRDKAIEALRKSDLADRSPAIAFQLGTLHFESGELEKAKASLQEALKQFPNFRDAHRNLAIVLVQENEIEEALPHLIRAVELGSREGLTMGLLGYCHATGNNHRAALDAYRLAALTQPDEVQWKSGQAQALAQLGQAEDAVSIYEELLRKDPANANLWLLQADSLLALDKDISATANLELVHRIGSLPPESTLSLGHLFLQSELPDLALARYTSAVEAEAPVPFAKAVEAVELLLSYRETTHAATLAARIDDQYADPPTEALGRLTRARAIIELETGDTESGAKRLETWLSENPTDGEALILLARFRESSGNREEAEMLLEQASVFPDHAAAAFEAHGKLLVAVGEYDSAIEKLEQSLELEAKEPLVRYLEAIRELVD